MSMSLKGGDEIKQQGLKWWQGARPPKTYLPGALWVVLARMPKIKVKEDDEYER